VVELWRIKMAGPMVPFMAGFDAELERLGYTYFSARQQLWLANHVSGWLADGGLELGELDAERIGQYLLWRRSTGRTGFRTVKALAPLLGYLRGLGVVPPVPGPCAPSDPVEVLLERWRSWLLSERGVSERCAAGYVGWVRPFVASLCDGQRVRLEAATAAGVTSFIVAVSGTGRLRTAQATVGAMRSLLRWLHLEGLLACSLAGAVPKIADRREQLPKALAPAQLAALLDCCGQDTAGLRDYAMMVTMARLGLRAGEIAVLLLDDVDWARGEITVRGKPQRCDVLPLPADVGAAIARYLRHGRATTASDRHLFLRVLAPCRGLSATGVTQAVVAAGARSGLGPVTAHRLRHSAASAMLAAGSNLTEIGQVLRHQRTSTTAQYAKTDTEALRTLARPWPGSTP
jgi:site-specific recombinase XerD